MLLVMIVHAAFRCTVSVIIGLTARALLSIAGTRRLSFSSDDEVWVHYVNIMGKASDALLARTSMHDKPLVVQQDYFQIFVLIEYS